MPFEKTNDIVVFKPTGWTKDKQYPCIIFLSGIGERGDGSDAALTSLYNFIISPYNNIKAGLEKFNNCLLVAPQLASFKGEWDIATVDKGIDYALNILNANPKRLYLSGVSLGGGGVFKYADASLTNAQKFACIVPICGVYGLTNGGKNIAASGTPVWAFHAVDDSMVGVGNTHGQVDAINANNPKIKAKKTIYPTGNHYIWGKVFDPNNSPGIEGESVNVWQWCELNEVGSPVAVPVKASSPTTTPTTPTTIKAIAEATNITGNSATLDASKTTGASYYTWEMKASPSGAPIDVWPGGWSKGGQVVNVSKLIPGEYTFELTAGKSGEIARVPVSFTVGMAVSPVFVEIPLLSIPEGKTRVIVRNDKSVEFI